MIFTKISIMQKSLIDERTINLNATPGFNVCSLKFNTTCNLDGKTVPNVPLLPLVRRISPGPDY